MPEITPKALAFLAFHAEGIEPHAWAWDHGKGDAIGPPPWNKFTAWKHKRLSPGRYGLAQITITRAELRSLNRYWVRGKGLQKVNKQGRALIAASREAANDDDQALDARRGESLQA